MAETLPSYWRALGMQWDLRRIHHQNQSARRQLAPSSSEDINNNNNNNNNATAAEVRVWEDDPSVSFKLGHPKAMWLALRTNPRASGIALVILWGFVIWALVDPSAANEFTSWRTWITYHFTWLFMLEINVFLLFLIYVALHPRYSKLVIGPPKDKPEFGFLTWMTMLFTTGVGIGLFFFGAAEPIWHYSLPNRYSSLSSNQRAQAAINLTLFHWGVHTWGIYAVLGLAVGVATYTRGLPLTFKFTLYPLLGDLTFSWIGDLLDGLTAATTVFGVCTSLGLGVLQINTGLNRLFQLNDSTTTQVAIVWIITVIATASVASGIYVGIRRLSEIAFLLSVFIAVTVFFLGDTWFFLNLMVQSVGYYLQWLPSLSFHTGAFEQLGTAPDDDNAEATQSFMNDWTIFYFAWWISWAPFVGMFLARISRGRTVREFVVGCIVTPVAFEVFWFCVFGGQALEMQRETEAAGITTCASNNNTSSSPSSPANDVTLLSCQATTEIFFDVLDTWQIGDFLSVVSLICLLLYFVTSSDSASLIVDSLTSNGDAISPIPQRIFWAFTEGATATALLVAGGREALTALQASSICAGLPFGILMLLLVPSTLSAMQDMADERDALAHYCKKLVEQKKDDGGLARALSELAPHPPHHLQRQHWMHHALTPLVNFDGLRTPLRAMKAFFLSVVCPWWQSSSIACHVFHDDKGSWRWRAVWGSWLALTLYAWPTVLIVSAFVLRGIWPIAWVLYVCFACTLTSIRNQVRSSKDIEGWILLDFAWCLLAYPLVVHQMHTEVHCGGCDGGGEHHVV